MIYKDNKKFVCNYKLLEPRPPNGMGGRLGFTFEKHLSRPSPLSDRHRCSFVYFQSDTQERETAIPWHLSVVRGKRLR